MEEKDNEKDPEVGLDVGQLKCYKHNKAFEAILTEQNRLQCSECIKEAQNGKIL